MDGDTGTHSELRRSKGVQTVFYTVYNQTTEECMGDDFTIDGALDKIRQLNKEDSCEDWTYYANENASVLDSMISLVQDHQNSQNNLGGQG